MEILGIFSVFPIKLRIPVLPLLRFGMRINADKALLCHADYADNL